jgi:hypothetical protein
MAARPVYLEAQRCKRLRSFPFAKPRVRMNPKSYKKAAIPAGKRV